MRNGKKLLGFYKKRVYWEYIVYEKDVDDTHCALVTLI